MLTISKRGRKICLAKCRRAIWELVCKYKTQCIINRFMSFMSIVSCIHKCVVELSRTQKVKGIHRNEKQSCKNLHGLKSSSESCWFFQRKINGIHNEPEKINDSVQQLTDRKLINSRPIVPIPSTLDLYLAASGYCGHETI